MLKKRLNHNRSMMNRINMRNNVLNADKAQKPIKLHLVKKGAESQQHLSKINSQFSLDFDEPKNNEAELQHKRMSDYENMLKKSAPFKKADMDSAGPSSIY